ncbi:hypothetical protein HJC23_000742 [Cyclotella cryptica]|uniref:Sulfotransferase domain-containing protein n=1 Tax=Cyclotella cryptica TaxID=29204 RepID=A0ABD3NKS7_9STRA|eukprot:CCRYP_020761-RA/>CCRYP_020761-RA protein AED:0.17 eAED:0.17 QI:0/-1/0/1/-1/1/1/0/465
MPHRSKRRQRLMTCLTIWIIKWTITLVLLNFYWGSRIQDLEKKSLASFGGLVNHDFLGLRDEHSKNNSTAANLRLSDQKDASRIIPGENTTHNDASDTPKGGHRMIVPNLLDGTLQGKERLWNILQTRNITEVDASYWASVPTWDEILTNLYPNSKLHNLNTSGPIIHGLETCRHFQDLTSSAPSQRRIAPAGIFNTGTNYLSVLLEYNCQNPHRVAKFHGNAKRGHGNEWEVPWGKHTPAHHRGTYSKNAKANYDVWEVLPVVLIRNPYGWMKSMCRNSYTATWRGKNDVASCPQLRIDGQWNEVDVKFGPGSTHHKSLAHMWNDWYGEYFYNNYSMNETTTIEGDSQRQGMGRNWTSPFPRLMIRFEDITFFPYEVTQQICSCAGGVLGHRSDDKDVSNDSFHYVVRSAKTGDGHGPTSHRNGLIDSWVRYGRVDPKTEYKEDVLKVAEEVFDSLMLKTFGYG